MGLGLTVEGHLQEERERDEPDGLVDLELKGYTHKSGRIGGVRMSWQQTHVLRRHGFEWLTRRKTGQSTHSTTVTFVSKTQLDLKYVMSRL